MTPLTKHTEQLEETKDTGNGKKVLHNSAHTETQIAREKIGKESTEQRQIMETVGNKEENMKQKIRKTIQNGNPNIKEEYEIIKENKAAKDVKEQSTNDQQLPKVAITKQNVTNITTTSKKEVATRTQRVEERSSARN